MTHFLTVYAWNASASCMLRPVYNICWVPQLYAEACVQYLLSAPAVCWGLCTISGLWLLGRLRRRRGSCSEGSRLQWEVLLSSSTLFDRPLIARPVLQAYYLIAAAPLGAEWYKHTDTRTHRHTDTSNPSKFKLPSFDQLVGAYNNGPKFKFQPASGTGWFSYKIWTKTLKHPYSIS